MDLPNRCCPSELYEAIKEALYRMWCGANRLGDSGVHTFGDNSAFVKPASQLLLTRRGKTRMDAVGIVFEFYTALLYAGHSSKLAFLRNRGNWKTQAHTGRIVVDYAAHSKNLRVSNQLGALGRQRIHFHVTGDWMQE